MYTEKHMKNTKNEQCIYDLISNITKGYTHTHTHK